jgi:hypothetical protein
MSSILRAAGAAALLSFTSLAFAASTQSPSINVELTVNPSNAAAGSTLLVTGSATNNTNKSEALVTSYNVTGPCGYNDDFSYSFNLAARKTRTATVNYVAPACAGTYTIQGTVSSGGNALAVVSTNFTVF